MTRVRLSSVDLSPEELEAVTQMRVLISEVSALQLDAEAKSLLLQPRRAPNVRFLTALLEKGCLEVRSAPLAGWSPDFTVFLNGHDPVAVVTGFHAFERPYPHRGPALVSVHGADGARLAARRHRDIWEVAHDIGPVLWNLLAGARRRTWASVSTTG